MVVDVLPRVFGLFRKVDFPASLELDLKKLAQFPIIPNVLIAGGGQIQQGVALSQQCDDGLTPVNFDNLLFEVNRPPDAVFKAQTAACHGQMNMRVPVKLATVGVQCDEQANLYPELFGPLQQGAGRAGKESVEQGPAVSEGGPEFVGHGEGHVLPFAVGQNVLLFSNPLLGGLHAAGPAAFVLTAVANVFGVRSMR